MYLRRLWVVSTMALLLCVSFQAIASDLENIDKGYSYSVSSIVTLKVYIEGGGIDYDYIRRNIDFVDFVNDPKAADVHVILTSNPTGSGGRNYILNFYTQNLSQIGDISLNCISAPGDTQDSRRECITRALKLGLMPYVNETADGELIDIRFNKPVQRDVKDLIVEDPWKQWVFRLDASGGFNLEESIKNNNYSFNVRADKVSENIKLRASYFMRNRYEQIDNSGDIIKSINNFKNGRAETVYSLSTRWSAGVFVSFFQSTYWNTRHSYDFKPAIEYNFFPWEDADKRRFTVAYFAGVELKDYYETTIFGKDAENLWAHNLQVDFEVIQPWGEIETRLEGSTYMHDITKNHIVFDSDLSFRITKGLSFNMGFRAENIHNQLYLPAGEVSLEDILLGNQKLPSTFDVSGRMGIRFQFGSLFNNVVNNRL